MEYRRIALWRRILVLLSLVMALTTWIYVLTLGFPLKALGGTVLGDRQLAIYWVAIAIASALSFWAFHGALPDRFSALIPVCVAINIFFGVITIRLGLPFYFDTMGTMLAGIIGGPLMAIATAFLTLCMWGFNAPILIPHILSALAVAIFVGIAAADRKLSSIGSIMRVGLITGVVAGAFSALTVNVGLARTAMKGTTDFANFFIMIRFEPSLAYTVQSLIVDPIDKIFSLLFVCIFIRMGAKWCINTLQYKGNEDRLTSILSGPGSPLSFI